MWDLGMSQHSGSVSPLSEHPASPALLTNHGPHRHVSSPQAAAWAHRGFLWMRPSFPSTLLWGRAPPGWPHSAHGPTGQSPLGWAAGSLTERCNAEPLPTGGPVCPLATRRWVCWERPLQGQTDRQAGQTDATHTRGSACCPPPPLLPKESGCHVSKNMLTGRPREYCCDTASEAR